MASEIAKQSITIEANATEDGHLYGSVGAPEISAALKNNDKVNISGFGTFTNTSRAVARRAKSALSARN